MRRTSYRNLPGNSGRYIPKALVGMRNVDKSTNLDGLSAKDSRKVDRLLIKANSVGGIENLGSKASQTLTNLTKGANITDEARDKRAQALKDANVKTAGQAFQGAFSNGSTGANVLSEAADIVSGAVNTASKVDTNETQQAAKNAIINEISTIPGYGTAIAAALKVADAVGNATGTNLDAMNKTQAKAAGISGFARFANNAIGALPGTFLGALVGDTMNAYNTKDVAELSDAFGGTTSDIDTANTMGGKSYLFGKRKANQFISRSNNQVDELTALNQTNSIRKKADTEAYAMQNERLYSGRSMGSDRTYVGKNGLKLMSVSDAKRILSQKKGGSMNESDSELQSLVALMAGFVKGDQNAIIGAEHAFDEAQHKNGYDYNERAADVAMRTIQNPSQEILLMCKQLAPAIQKKLENSPEGLQTFTQMFQNFNPQTVSTVATYLNEALGGKLQLFQNGGTIGIDTNILPEGALHKNKNHLEDVNPEVGSEVTEKGIPVIVTDSEGNIEQVAEIEKEEIILRKEITKRIEELWNDGSEDAMIEAGKILAEEIITNTQDNTGQLDGNDNNNN